MWPFRKIEVKASPLPPLVRVTSPGMARTTPRRFDKLAAEGYRDNPIGFAAINTVARAASSVPLEVWRGDRLLDNHPLVRLLAKPSPFRSGASDFFEAMYANYLISGNAYILGVGPQNGPPRELHNLRPDTVKIIPSATGVTGFVQTVGSESRTFPAEDVMHFRTFNPLDDFYGLPPIEAAALGVDIFNEGSRWNLSTIQKGGQPSGALQYKPADGSALSQEQFDRLKADIDQHISGAGNAGRPLLLEGGLEWKSMAMSPKDMDWTAAKNMTAREIALVYGVPPQLVGIPDAATFANYQEARRALWEDTVIPLVGRSVTALNAWLSPLFGPDIEIRADLDESPALEARREAKFQRAQAADFLTINEKRELVGLAPVDGGDTVLVDAAKLPLTFERDLDKPRNDR